MKLLIFSELEQNYEPKYKKSFNSIIEISGYTVEIIHQYKKEHKEIKQEQDRKRKSIYTDTVKRVLILGQKTKYHNLREDETEDVYEQGGHEEDILN
jgi:predicted nucleotide-binding protein (sugar kinase/HSP70/actin superfamily)